MKKTKDESSKLTKEERFLNQLKNEIHSYFDINYEQAISLNQLHKTFAVKDRSMKFIYQGLVDELTAEGKLVRRPDGTYQIDNGLRYRTGRIEHANPRFAFLVSEETEHDGDDIWIATEDLNGALDGDRVKVAVFQGSKRSGRRAEGQVEEILERKRTELVGTLDSKGIRFGIVIPDSRRIYQDFAVPLDALNGAQPGEKVIIEITQFPAEGVRAEGRVKEVLGKAGENNTEMHAILAEFGLPYQFPESLEAEAASISDVITEEEIAKRRDFRGITTFTIDPVDAKDFDDALSIEYLENGNVEIGVHIADVTHYVRPGSDLEQEAVRRATSVYLVDRTVPMLPEKLSNNLCSLRPNEDKLTFSAVFELTPDARVEKQWFGRTVIHSDKRFSYEEAQEVLDGAESPFSRDLLTLNALAKRLRDLRFANGAVNFETVEVKFRLDPTGKPLDVYQKIRKDAHKLIEEFMLLANKKVAEYVYHLRQEDPRNTMVYRVHEAPDADRLKTFAQFAKRFGYQIQAEGKGIAASLNRLMEDVSGKPEQNVMESLAIRTMAKARYSTEAIGHFGLAFAHYSHFTSPIRRYPDMMAHRLLQHYLDGGKPEERGDWEAKCKHSSEMEKLAAEAERASIKYKQVEFMSQQPEDEEFAGLITGVTEFGIFVEITSTACEGLIKMGDLRDDFYELDRDNYRIVGKRSGRIFTFGDPVRVRVKETNLARRSMDLSLVGSGGRTVQPPARGGRNTAMPRGKQRERGTRRK